MHRQRIAELVLLSFICLITLLVYLPGLNGSFVLDDYRNIVTNKGIHVEGFTPEALSQLFVGADGKTRIISSRPVAMLSFAMNYFIGGLEPYGFKLMNLLIHLCTGWTIFLVMSWIFRANRLLENNIYHPLKSNCSRWIALLTTIIWLIHPLNVSTVLYSVQRMAQLSALFTLLGFAAYLRCRLLQLENTRFTGRLALFTGLFICWPLGILSKENAIILPLLCFVAEITLFRFVAISVLLRRLHHILVLAIFITVAYLLYNPDFVLSVYRDNRDFTLGQRLMTESRVLWVYVHSLLLPDLTRMGLFLDDFLLSTGFLNPMSTLLSTVAWCAVLLTAIFMRQCLPILSFSILWFLTGHILESSFIGLEIAFEHRNYLPGIGVILCLSWCVVTLYQQQERLRPVFRLTGIGILILLISLTLLRNHQWSTSWKYTNTEVRHHPLSYRANEKLALELMEIGRFAEAEVVLQKIKHTVRPFANHYFKLLLTKHAGDKDVSETFYREMTNALANQRVHVSILNEFVLYLSNADTYGWLDAQRSITFANALSRNRSLQSNISKGRLSRALVKLYADMGDYPMLLHHLEIAHKQFPEDKELAKLYDDAVNNKIRRIEMAPYQ